MTPAIKEFESISLDRNYILCVFFQCHAELAIALCNLAFNTTHNSDRNYDSKKIFESPSVSAYVSNLSRPEKSDYFFHCEDSVFKGALCSFPTLK